MASDARREVIPLTKKQNLNEVYHVERTFLSKVTPENVISKIIQTVVLDNVEDKEYNVTVDVAMNGDRYEH